MRYDQTTTCGLLRLLLIPLLLPWDLGCVGEIARPIDTEHEEVAVTEQGIVGGTPWNGNPEIGQVVTDAGICTATLIARRVVITAAHCFDFRDRPNLGIHGTFEIDTGAGRRVFSIVSYESFLGSMDEWRVNWPADIALVQLGEDVPSWLATPRSLAFNHSVGDALISIGYGCNQFDVSTGHGTGAGTKRVAYGVVTGYGPKLDNGANVCPGDSGGPLIQASTGAVLGVAAYFAYSSSSIVYSGWAYPDRVGAPFFERLNAYFNASNIFKNLTEMYGIFDAGFYTLRHTDVVQQLGSGTDALISHWNSAGRAEWRAASTTFDSVYYYYQHPDLQQFFPDELVTHWMNHGLDEGRRSSLYFDVRDYLARYPDLRDAFGADNYRAALAHWLSHGLKEGRRGSQSFDPAYYLSANPDVARAFGARNYLAAIVHYDTYGRYEGRRAVP